MIDESIVLGVEDRMDSGETDVLVDAAVASDVVRVEQLVIVSEIGSGERIKRLRIAGEGVVIGGKIAQCVEYRYCVVCDVNQELVTGTHCVSEVDRRQWITFDHEVIGRARESIRPLHHNLWETMLAADVISVSIGRQQRNVVEVPVGQINAEDVARLRLDDGPGCHAANFDVVGSTEVTI